MWAGMAAPEYFEKWVGGIRVEHRELALALRGLVLEIEPGIEEGLKWGSPTFVKDRANRIYISDHERYIRLGFYNGASLANADGLVEGTGKRLRNIKVRSIGDPPLDALRVHVAESIAMDPSASHETRTPRKT